MKNILIIGTRDSGAKNDPTVISNSLKSESMSTRLVFWEDITVEVLSGVVEIRSLGEPIFDDQLDLVIALGWYKNGSKSIYRDIAYSVALVLMNKQIPYWNSEMGSQRSTTKLSCMVELALANIPVPDSYYSLKIDVNTMPFNYPLIAKAVAASRGENNFLVENVNDLKKIVLQRNDMILQKFMPNDHDIRVICFGSKPALVLKRSRDTSSSTHMNNTSQGGTPEWLNIGSFNAEVLTTSEKICKITKREMAGIDFIPDATSPIGYSCLEVNAIPQLTSGHDTDKKLNALKQVIMEYQI